MRSLESTIRYYHDRAAIYDATAGYLDAEAEPRRELLKQLFKRYLRGRRVLEVACGTGYWTQFIAKSASAILATDRNSEVIDLARRIEAVME